MARYQKTAQEYCDLLYTRSIALAEFDKHPEVQIEVTHEHVRDAADSLARRRQEASRLQTWCQVGEYVCAIGAGVGGGKLDEKWGVGVLAATSVIGVILFIIRSNQQR